MLYFVWQKFKRELWLSLGSSFRPGLVVYFLQFFSNLAEAHGCVREHLVLCDLFLNYLGEDYLK